MDYQSTANQFNWHYVGYYGPLGPLSDEQMEGLIRDGVIESNTYVWREGMPDWQLAGQVPEFSRSLQVAQRFVIPPPVPVKSSNHPPSFDHRQPPLSYDLSKSYSFPKSDRSRVVAGLLQIIPGVGRMYLGYTAYGIVQLILTPLSCFVLWLWSLIDGIVILSGGVQFDGYGRRLED